MDACAQATGSSRWEEDGFDSPVDMGWRGRGGGSGEAGVDSPADLGWRRGGGGACMCVKCCWVLTHLQTWVHLCVCMHVRGGWVSLGLQTGCVYVFMHIHICVCVFGGGGGAVAFFHYRWHCIDYPTLSRQTLSFSFVFLVSLCFVAIVSFLDFCCDWVWKNVFHAPQNGRNLISWLGRIILQQPAFPKESYWLSCGNSSELRHWNAPMHPIVLRSPCAVDRTLKTSY